MIQKMKRRKNVCQGYKEVICNCCLVDRIRWPILPCISYNAISDTMITTYCWLTQKEITFVVGTSTSCRERACDRSVFRRLLKPNERFIVTASMIKATTMRRIAIVLSILQIRRKKPRETLRRINSTQRITLSSRNCLRRAIKCSVRLTSKRDSWEQLNGRKDKSTIFD